MDMPQKLEIEISYHAVISVLGIYPKKMKTQIQKDTCTPMFTEALFTIAKIREQAKCPQTEDLIKKM